MRGHSKRSAGLLCRPAALIFKSSGSHSAGQSTMGK